MKAPKQAPVAPTQQPDVDNAFLQEVLEGLARSPKQLASKYFYDARGSRLFEEICELPEYYPTRTEVEMMRQIGPEIAELLGPNRAIIEYGSGAGIKTRQLLEALESPRAYVPVEISASALAASVEELEQDFPGLHIDPICADYTRSFELPSSIEGSDPIVFYPGSTIGNFTPNAAVAFMRLMREQVGDSGGVLIGVDLKKDPNVLHAAYNDSRGVTAAFNLNVAVRLRDELGADIDVEKLRHYALYNPVEGRIEMHLVNTTPQAFTVGGERFELDRGETILTEYSYKYSVAGFAELSRRAGFAIAQTWTDPEQLFSIHYLEAVS